MYPLSCCRTIYLTPEELVTPGKQVKAAANWSSRLPWMPVRHGEWRWLRRRSSTCRSRLCEGACRRETKALTCRSLALWPNVRHDTIVVPEMMSPAQVRALAQRTAQAQVGDDDMVAFLHLHGSRPVGGEHGTVVEWRYS